MAYTPDESQPNMTMDREAVQRDANARYSASDPYQASLVSKYRQYHQLYAPPGGDQWPQDQTLRPGKIHVTENIVRPAIEVGARLESLLPRITIPTAGMDEATRKRAEAAEILLLTWLEMSGWDVWLNDHCRVKRLYGKGILKPYWNDADKRPDVSSIEDPSHLRIGWGMSDYSIMDWALFEYSISPAEALRRWPDVVIQAPERKEGPLRVVVTGDHADPLQMNASTYGPSGLPVPKFRDLSDYERKMVNVWDYWYRDGDNVCNAILLQGVVVSGPDTHPEYPAIPYIVNEFEHEPGSPEGTSQVETISDIQIELNRLISHGLQHVADDTDPAWYYHGLDGAGMPEGMVPRAGEIMDAGNGDVLLLNRYGGVNVQPIDVMINALWEGYHKTTGLPEILFGNLPGADSSGRAVAVQVEAASGRLDPNRNRTYRTLRQLMVFWVYMAEHKNPKIDVGTDAETGATIKKGLAEVFTGFRRFKIIAPEITPRDSLEAGRGTIDKINARLMSLRTGMDETGIESPESEIELIKTEQRDVYLNPQAAQAIVSIFPMLQQLQQQAQAQLQQGVNAATGGQIPPGQPPVGPPGMNATAQAQVAANGLQNQQFSAQPGGLQPDQNQPSPGAPQTQAGMAPPAGGQGPAVTTLIRGGKALNQLAFSSGNKSAAASIPGHP